MERDGRAWNRGRRHETKIEWDGGREGWGNME